MLFQYFVLRFKWPKESVSGLLKILSKPTINTKTLSHDEPIGADSTALRVYYLSSMTLSHTATQIGRMLVSQPSTTSAACVIIIDAIRAVSSLWDKLCVTFDSTIVRSFHTLWDALSSWFFHFTVRTINHKCEVDVGPNVLSYSMHITPPRA